MQFIIAIIAVKSTKKKKSIQQLNMTKNIIIAPNILMNSFLIVLNAIIIYVKNVKKSIKIII